MSRVLLLDCNLDPSSGEVFRAAIARLAPPSIALVCHRVPDAGGDTWVADAPGVSGLIVSGSAAGIQSGPPWVAPLAQALREVTAGGMPTFGICFGHQLLAYAWGGEIKEDLLGYKIRDICQVTVSEDARESAIFGPEPQLDVLSSHRDQVVAEPPGWQVLAHSSLCPIQALHAVGLPLWSVQWHPEADEAFVNENPHPDWDRMLNPIQSAPPDLVGLSGNRVLGRFFAAVVGESSKRLT